MGTWGFDGGLIGMLSWWCESDEKTQAFLGAQTLAKRAQLMDSNHDGVCRIKQTVPALGYWSEPHLKNHFDITTSEACHARAAEMNGGHVDTDDTDAWKWDTNTDINAYQDDLENLSTTLGPAYKCSG